MESIYITFMPDLYNYIVEKFPAMRSIEEYKSAFYMLAAVIIAQVSWTILEKPLLGLKKKFE